MRQINPASLHCMPPSAPAAPLPHEVFSIRTPATTAHTAQTYQNNQFLAPGREVSGLGSESDAPAHAGSPCAAPAAHPHGGPWRPSTKRTRESLLRCQEHHEPCLVICSKVFRQYLAAQAGPACTEPREIPGDILTCSTHSAGVPPKLWP